MKRSLNQQVSRVARLGKIAPNRERLRKLVGRLVDALFPTWPQAGGPRLRPVVVRPPARRRDWRD